MEDWVDRGYPAMERPGVELATSRSQIRRPNLYTTETLSQVQEYNERTVDDTVALAFIDRFLNQYRYVKSCRCIIPSFIIPRCRFIARLLLPMANKPIGLIRRPCDWYQCIRPAHSNHTVAEPTANPTRPSNCHRCSLDQYPLRCILCSRLTV